MRTAGQDGDEGLHAVGEVLVGAALHQPGARNLGHHIRRLHLPGDADQRAVARALHRVELNLQLPATNRLLR